MSEHKTHLVLRREHTAMYQCRACGRLFRHTPTMARKLADHHDRTGQ